MKLCMILFVVVWCAKWSQAQSNDPRAARALAAIGESQSASGSWTSTLADDYTATTQVLQAFHQAPQDHEAVIANAESWLAAQVIRSIPEASMRLVALGADAPETDRALLDSAHREWGGRGFAKGYGLTTMDTALALRAYQTLTGYEEERFANFSFLVRTKNSSAGGDSGWGRERLSASTLWDTAIVLEAAAGEPQYEVGMNASVVFLRACQNVDGGYGHPTSTFYETARVLLSIYQSRQTLTDAEVRARNYVNGRIDAEVDPFAKALAVRVLEFPVDSDFDGMPDHFERRYSFMLDLNDSEDAELDEDEDGLSNVEEYRHGTIPNNKDTDRDGVDDFTEIQGGSDPLDDSVANRPPVILSQAPTVASVGQLFAYDLLGGDPDQDEVTFELVEAPEGADLDGGQIRWTPTAGQEGEQKLVVKASDGVGHGFQRVTVTVLGHGIDYRIHSVDAGGAIFDPQALTVTGALSGTVVNGGGASAEEPVTLLAFEDRNGDGFFDPDIDSELGRVDHEDRLPSLGEVGVTIPLSGNVRFAYNRLHIIADPDDAIEELLEDNNSSDSGLLVRREIVPRDFEPAIKWSWISRSKDVRHTPIVGPLVDTNGDGLIDERDTPHVIAADGSLSAEAAHVYALNGVTGMTVWEAGAPSGGLARNGTPTLGDINGDGLPEITMPRGNTGLHAFDHTGELLWTSDYTRNFGSPPGAQLVDLDADGTAEMLYELAFINGDGSTRAVLPFPGYGGGGGWGQLQAADLNLDGIPEVIGGPSALDRDGNPIWWWQITSGLVSPYPLEAVTNFGATKIEDESLLYLRDGPAVVANLDDDPMLEVIVSTSTNSIVSPHHGNSIWFFEHDGSLHRDPFPVLQNVFNERVSGISPPVVADLNGDGEPEVLLKAHIQERPQTFESPSRTEVRAYRLDGSLLWVRTLVRDFGNAGWLASAPLVYDFDGDGRFEIVVSDKHGIRLLAGESGDVLWEMQFNNLHNVSVGSTPSIADVDNDGQAEILIPESDGFYTFSRAPSGGVFVIGDLNGNWTHARPVWNQHEYVPGHIKGDATMPSVLPTSDSPNQSTRIQQHQSGVPIDAAADLSVSNIRVNAEGCPDAATINARVGNGGSLQVANGQVIDFYHGGPEGALIGSTETIAPLYPGEFEDVSVLWESPEPGLIHVALRTAEEQALISSDNLSLLPFTWARTSGLGDYGWVAHEHLNAGWMIDSANTFAKGNWFDRLENANLDPGPHWFEVNFPQPVTASSVTIQGAGAMGYGVLAGRLAFSNGFTMDVELDANGDGTFEFPPQEGIRSIRLTASETLEKGGGVAEFIVGGTYRENHFPVREPVDRLANNVLSVELDPCAQARNGAPEILTSPPNVASVGVRGTYQVVAEDPNGDPLSYALTEASEGMAVSPTGLVYWKPTRAGALVAMLEVSDLFGAMAAQEIVLTVEAVETAHMPLRITSEPSETARVAMAYQYSVMVESSPEAELYFTLESPPRGVAMSESGVLTWTPEPDQLGLNRMSVEVHDGEGQVVRQRFLVKVLDAVPQVVDVPGDADGDGYPADEDCDDTNPLIHPGMTEIIGNGVDDDCNPATPDQLDDVFLKTTITTLTPRVSPGETIALRLMVQNVGDVSAPSVVRSLEITDADGQVVVTTEASTGPMAAGFPTVSFYNFEVPETAPSSAYTATLRVRYGEEEYGSDSLTIFASSGEPSAELAIVDLALRASEVDLHYTVRAVGPITVERSFDLVEWHTDKAISETQEGENVVTLTRRSDKTVFYRLRAEP